MIFTPRLNITFLILLLSVFGDYSFSFHEIPCNSTYILEYCDHVSSDTLETVDDFERCAAARIHDIRVRDYMYGGPGRRITLRENQNAFETIRIRKRVLRDVSNHSLEITVLGKRVQFPVAIAPTAGQTHLDPEKEIAMAKAAASMGTVMVLSDYSHLSLEEVAASVPPGADIWMETNFFPSRSFTVDLVRRAEKAGYKAMVVVVDINVEEKWNCINHHRYEETMYNYTKHPNMVPHEEIPASRSATFADVNWLKGITHLPVVVKGILTGDDAVEAVKAGASAIYVSNHGGRRLDGSQATIDILREVVDAVHAVSPSTEVYMDSGIRHGFDVFKALARGARAVFIGRPSLWGLAIGGERGVKKVLSILRNEFEEAMLHAGFSRPDQITRDSIVPQKPSFICGSRYPL